MTIGLKAENYLLNCRVETISSPSKSAPRIFQTSPEHPNARIIISPPFGNPSPKGRTVSASGGDIFDPQPPTKARKAMAMAISVNSDDNTRRSSRKRTVKTYDDSSSDIDSEDMVENKRRRVVAAKRRVSEPVKDAAAMISPGEPRRRKSSTKLLESTESTPKTKKEKKEDWKPSGSGKNASREKEARLDRKENEELYEALQKQVTIDLLKRRYNLYYPPLFLYLPIAAAPLFRSTSSLPNVPPFLSLFILSVSFEHSNSRGIPTTEQEEMVMDICKKLGLEKNNDLATRAATSVRYWVAHKSWRLRDHFKFLGQRYKSQHRNEDWSNSIPPVSAVKLLTNQKEVERWLFQSLGMRLAQRRMMSNPDIRRALWIVFVAGLRYGIRAAYDGRMTSPVFQAAIESLDVFTKDFEYPVNETTGFRGKMKVIKDESEEEGQEEGEGDELPGWEFDWGDVEEVLKGVQEG